MFSMGSEETEHRLAAVTIKTQPGKALTSNDERYDFAPISIKTLPMVHKN